ncbi:MAG: hypothetical protein ACRD68_10330, partial [Pyrinomonadaceae bacterium]
RNLEFDVELDTGICKLTLVLVKEGGDSAKAISAEFFGVADLALRDFGGGVTQLLHLVIEDIGDKQLDRINYMVREIERESISFVCQKVSVTNAL